MNENYSKHPSRSHDLKKDRWRQALSASAVFWSTACIFGPLIVQRLPDGYDYSISFIIPLLFVSSILTLLTSFLLVQMMPARLFTLAVTLILSLGFIVYVRAFLSSYIATALRELLINLDLHQHYFLIGAVLLSAAFVTIVLMRRFIVRRLYSIAIVFIIFQLVFVSLWYLFGPIKDQKYTYHLTNVYKNSFSKSRNILVLVFDTFGTRDFQELLDCDRNIPDCLEGFTFYPDSLGGAAATRAAISNILTGLWYDNSVPLNTFLRSNLPTESIPGILKKASYRTEAYGYGAGFALQAPVLDNITTETSLFPGWRDVASFIYQFCLRCTPDFAKKYLVSSYFINSWESAVYDLFRIEELEKLAHADTAVPVFKFEHFFGIHPRYWLSASMEIHPPAQTSDARREQARATIKLCCKYLKVLKRIGVFDNSMIFVIGDHGFEAAHRPFSLMLWKPFNNSQPFRVSSEPVAQADIIKTICDELSISINSPYSESLRHEGVTASRIRRYLHYSWVDEPTNEMFISKMAEFRVVGRMDSVFSLIPTFTRFTPGRKELTPQLEIGSVLEFRKEGNYSGYVGIGGWGLPAVDHVWNYGKTAELFLPINNMGLPIGISIRCSPFVSASNMRGQTLKVIDGNGKLLFEGKLTEPSTVTFQVPSDAFIGGVLPLQFQFPNEISQSSLDVPSDMAAHAVSFESLTITTDSTKMLSQ